MIVTRPPEPTFYDGYKQGVYEAGHVLKDSIMNVRLIATALDPDTRERVLDMLAVVEHDFMHYEFADEEDC